MFNLNNAICASGSRNALVMVEGAVVEKHISRSPVNYSFRVRCVLGVVGFEWFARTAIIWKHKFVMCTGSLPPAGQEINFDFECFANNLLLY